MTLQRFSHAGAAPATGLSGSITASTTSFSILSGTGYPTGSGGPFVCVIDQGTASEEKILVASITSNTVTVQGGVSGRGYDGTSAASHNGGTTNFEHVFAAVEADDDNDHIYTTSRNDHTQYVLYSGLTTSYGVTASGSGTATDLSVVLSQTQNAASGPVSIGNGSFTEVAGITGLTSGGVYLLSATATFQGANNALINMQFSTNASGSGAFGPPMEGYLVAAQSQGLAGSVLATGSTSYYLVADANANGVSALGGSQLLVVRAS